MKVILKNLTKIFRSRDKTKHKIVAVDDFTIEIPDGKLVGLLGPSGCGKSTVLNLISGLEVPTSGQIFFGDTDVTSLQPENRGIGLVFQNYALYPHLTVLQNILFPLQNLKGKDRLSKEAMMEKALAAAKLVQIDSLLGRKPGEMSGGQQQRVAIARAMVKTPNVLLLDEPLSNLDARLRLQTREEIKRIQQETGVTSIFVTHDQEEAMSISDLIIVMKNGRIQQTGKPQDVYDDPENLFVAEFLGTPAINVFSGEVKDEILVIGDEKVMSVPGIADQKVYAGIRPEGFIPDENGTFSCMLNRVEVMGRDISVISTHPCAKEGKAVRSIISSDSRSNISGRTVTFSLKRHKVVLFNEETGQRLYFRL